MPTPWTLYDPVDDETYTFARNPTSSGVFTRSRTITATPTTAPDADPVVFEGQAPRPTLNVSALATSREEHDAIEAWFDKPTREIEITDDAGRTYVVLLAAWSTQRLLSGEHHYAWTLSCLVLAGPTSAA